jgi:hypothetical protein
MVSPVDLRSQLLWLDSDGIFHTQVKPHAEITLEDAREAMELCRLLCAGKRYPVLVDLTHCKAITREARAYYAGEEAAKSGVAAALLIGSPLSRVIGNFFMEFNKPLIPTRLFTSEAEALVWLKGFLE